MPEPANSALDDARKRARRRLVGAIVLALGAAVVVPVFLESDPKPLGPDVQIQIPAIDDAKFQNRLTPQQKGAATDKAMSSAPAAGAKPADTKPAEAASTAAVAKQAESAAEPVRPAGADPASAIPAPKADAATAGGAAPATKSVARETAADTASQSAAPHAAAAPDSVPKAAPAPKPAEKKAAPPKKAAAPAPATTEKAPATNLGTATLNTTPPAPSKSGEFVVQIGAFVDKTVATEMATKAGEQGFPVFLEGVTTKSGPVQRVRVGPFPNKGAADAAAAKLIAAGFTAEARPR